jgi:hypothetical protein
MSKNTDKLASDELERPNPREEVEEEGLYDYNGLQFTLEDGMYDETVMQAIIAEGDRGAFDGLNSVYPPEENRGERSKETPVYPPGENRGEIPTTNNSVVPPEENRGKKSNEDSVTSPEKNRGKKSNEDSVTSPDKNRGKNVSENSVPPPEQSRGKDMNKETASISEGRNKNYSKVKDGEMTKHQRNPNHSQSSITNIPSRIVETENDLLNMIPNLSINYEMCLLDENKDVNPSIWWTTKDPDVPKELYGQASPKGKAHQQRMCCCVTQTFPKQFAEFIVDTAIKYPTADLRTYGSGLSGVHSGVVWKTPLQNDYCMRDFITTEESQGFNTQTYAAAFIPSESLNKGFLIPLEHIFFIAKNQHNKITGRPQNIKDPDQEIPPLMEFQKSRFKKSLSKSKLNKENSEHITERPNPISSYRSPITNTYKNSEWGVRKKQKNWGDTNQYHHESRKYKRSKSPYYNSNDSSAEARSYSHHRSSSYHRSRSHTHSRNDHSDILTRKEIKEMIKESIQQLNTQNPKQHVEPNANSPQAQPSRKRQRMEIGEEKMGKSNSLKKNTKYIEDNNNSPPSDQDKRKSNYLENSNDEEVDSEEVIELINKKKRKREEAPVLNQFLKYSTEFFQMQEILMSLGINDNYRRSLIGACTPPLAGIKLGTQCRQIASLGEKRICGKVHIKSRSATAILQSKLPAELEPEDIAKFMGIPIKSEKTEVGQQVLMLDYKGTRVNADALQVAKTRSYGSFFPPIKSHPPREIVKNDKELHFQCEKIESQLDRQLAMISALLAKDYQLALALAVDTSTLLMSEWENTLTLRKTDNENRVHQFGEDVLGPLSRSELKQLKDDFLTHHMTSPLQPAQSTPVTNLSSAEMKEPSTGKKSEITQVTFAPMYKETPPPPPPPPMVYPQTAKPIITNNYPVIPTIQQQPIVIPYMYPVPGNNNRLLENNQQFFRWGQAEDGEELHNSPNPSTFPKFKKKQFQPHNRRRRN